MGYMVLRVLNDGSLLNLYPLKDGSSIVFKTLVEAKVNADRLHRLTLEEFVVLPVEEALKYEVPRRW